METEESKMNELVGMTEKEYDAINKKIMGFRKTAKTMDEIYEKMKVKDNKTFLHGYIFGRLVAQNQDIGNAKNMEETLEKMMHSTQD